MAAHLTEDEQMALARQFDARLRTLIDELSQPFETSGRCCSCTMKPIALTLANRAAWEMAFLANGNLAALEVFKQNFVESLEQFTRTHRADAAGVVPVPEPERHQ